MRHIFKPFLLFYSYIKLYVINKEANKIIEKKTIDEIIKKYVNLVLYKSKNNILYCFLNFINNEQKIKIISYQIDLGSNIILKEDFQMFKQNEPSIIQPINYPISLSEIRHDLSA